QGCCVSLPHPFSPAPYTLSLHDALPIWSHGGIEFLKFRLLSGRCQLDLLRHTDCRILQVRKEGTVAVKILVGDRIELVIVDLKRSEEHTSELQSPCNLVCRLLLEKKKTI